MGNPGWSFDELVPYFKKSQSHTPQDNKILPGTATVTAYEGLEGPVKVSVCGFIAMVMSFLWLPHRLPTTRGIRL
jgi:choline dehydrogenase-like flavoprotein